MKPHNLTNHLCTLLMLMLGLPLLCCCNNDDVPGETASTEFRDYTVAVIMPGTEEARWRRVADWALRSIEQSQEGFREGVRLKLEWIYQDDPQLAQISTNLAKRQDVAAIVGITENQKLNTVATAIARSNTRKPLIATNVQSEELIRRFSADKFLFSLCETDATQCELLLLSAQRNGAEKVALLAPDNAYGKTFYDNFSFQAIEMDLNPVSIHYYTPETLNEELEEALYSGCEYLICTPDQTEDVLKISRRHGELYYEGDGAPEILFASEALTNDVLTSCTPEDLFSGIAIACDPASGFSIEYGVRFGEQPLAGESQFYDALILSALAITDCRAQGIDPQASMAVNNALRRLLVGTTQKAMASTWSGIGLENEMRHLMQNTGVYHKLSGATGELVMNTETGTSLITSTYIEWYLYNQTFTVTAYVSSNGSHRTYSGAAGYEWRKTKEEVFDQNTTRPQYPMLEDQWAVLVAADEGWSQHRFQADVLGMYQMLRKNGMPDERIILIMADDLAHNPQNPTPGQVFGSINGENLYHDISLDYCIDSIKPEDLTNIFLGIRTQHTPTVLTTGEHDNVLVYWSGHGIHEQLCWLSERKEFAGKGFSKNQFAGLLQQMQSEKRYRKMLWIVEACHSQSVLKGCEGIQGVMGIAAAAAGETSKADEWSMEGGTWLCNRFSRILVNRLNSDPGMMLIDLYKQLNQGTTASHVMIENDRLFDNLYRCRMSEFINEQAY